ncbi:SPL family radical SAM protein [Thermohalobacter berrensis]|uniref:DNA repair photolyase n=1 Tax=Thermohalobacter berrensis TaxID=99594 RepID=A0A419SWE9_9FIRM|nr:radical SAM protein [Thermohalobacter berrensis]RKD29546.1 DNA repair photolyase [Thermohalobacter berrensis]
MKDLRKDLVLSKFSHIYIERDAKNHPNTRKIISKFKDATCIEIDHYKEVFCRGNQSIILQKESPKLILATKKDNFIYKGSEMCEDFGNLHFYYTSTIMNCFYNCEYCYLQGMYPSANIVIFVNIEDIFRKVEELLKSHSIYLCISYETDLLAFEGITSFVSKWIDFARKNDNLKIELRTKSGNFKAIENIKPLDNFILAWTLSHDEIIKKYEIGTPSLETRLKSINNAIKKGWKIRICFDPILYIKDWKKYYGNCIEETFKSIKLKNIYDVSIGVFRISKDYLKRVQKIRPHSKILAYPFECQSGICSYPKRYTKEMIEYVYNEVSKYIPEEKIYV